MKVLLFTVHGAAELLQSEEQGARILWSSDDDEEFAEEFGGEVLDIEADREEIVDYLIDHDYMEEGEDYVTDEKLVDSEEVYGLGDADRE